MRAKIIKFFTKARIILKKDLDGIENKLQTEIDELKNRIGELEKKNYIVERDLFASYKALEFKIWEFNNNCNKMLYEMNENNIELDKKFNPLVSIIIPVYNGSNYLEEAINSAINQNYNNIEIIVVNDGSTDKDLTKKIAQKYKKQIRYYDKENGGVSSALNYGIKKMNGEYFSWLSHDDLIEKDHIKNLVEYLARHQNEKVIPYASFKFVDENGVLKLQDTIIAQLHCFDYKTSILNNEYTLLQGEINGGSVLIPRVAFTKHGGFDENQRITQERDMWSRLITEYRFINIPYDTAIIRSHSSQVTNTNQDIKVKSDEKNLEIITELGAEIKKKLAGSESSFYVIMREFYNNNGNRYMSEKMNELLLKCDKEKE